MQKDCLNPYSVSKTAGEELCAMYYSLYGLETVSFRYFNVYGPEGEEHKGSQASPHYQFKRQAEETGVVKVFENSDQYRRDFVHVSQIVDTHIKFFDVPESGIWNVGTGTTQSFVDVARLYTTNLVEIPMPDVLRSNYQSYTCADVTKLNETLQKYTPR